MTHHINPTPARLGAFKGRRRDALLIAHDPAVDTFLAIVGHSEYQKEVVSRQATLKGTRMIRTTPATDQFA